MPLNLIIWKQFNNNFVCISKPDFAFSYFMSIFWGFCLTFKLAVKCNARNHLESYHRLNSLINVICHDGMPLDYYFFFLIADCASIFLTSSFLKLVKPNSCLWIIVFDYNHLYQSYARVNSDLLLSLIKKKSSNLHLSFYKVSSALVRTTYCHLVSSP